VVTLGLCECAWAEQPWCACGQLFLQERFPPGGAAGRGESAGRACWESAVSHTAHVLAFAGQDEGQSIAFALLGTDLSFFLLSPFIPHRKEQLVTGVRRLTMS